ncbi:MAG: cupin domain-containing protein [Gallionella sp.]|nr:cupin domain-containing protein [Gallionella sp.]MDD4957955.1 cupin domain-containing protein [Gallionella sp.]
MQKHSLPIVNIAEVVLESASTEGQFGSNLASIGQMLGAKKLGYRLCAIPPGKRAWPYHAHLVNEEMVFVIEGTGTVRYADGEYPIKAGDVIAFVAGIDRPHQIINTSVAELRYLAVSTMEEPEIALYPDSGKFGVLAGSAPGANRENRTFEIFAKQNAGVPYWDGELNK